MNMIDQCISDHLPLTFYCHTSSILLCQMKTDQHCDAAQALVILAP